MMLLRLTAALALFAAPFCAKDESAVANLEANPTWERFNQLVAQEKTMHDARRKFEKAFLQKFNLPDYKNESGQIETKRIVFPGSYSADMSKADENLCLQFTDAYSYGEGVWGLYGHTGWAGYELTRVEGETNLWRATNESTLESWDARRQTVEVKINEAMDGLEIRLMTSHGCTTNLFTNNWSQISWAGEEMNERAPGRFLGADSNYDAQWIPMCKNIVGVTADGEWASQKPMRILYQSGGLNTHALNYTSNACYYKISIQDDE